MPMRIFFPFERWVSQEVFIVSNYEVNVQILRHRMRDVKQEMVKLYFIGANNEWRKV